MNDSYNWYQYQVLVKCLDDRNGKSIKPKWVSRLDIKDERGRLPKSIIIPDHWYETEAMEFYFSKTERVALVNRFEIPEDSDSISPAEKYRREYYAKNRDKLNEKKQAKRLALKSNEKL